MTTRHGGKRLLRQKEKMHITDATNNDVRRFCHMSTAQSRYPTVIVTWLLLLLLMMFYSWIGVTATAVSASKAVSMATGGDMITWTLPASASLYPVSVRAQQTAPAGRFQFAPLPRQDDSSGLGRLGAAGRRALIAPHRLAGSDSPGHRAATLPRPEAVNYPLPPATTASATVNVAPVIRTSRDRQDGPGRISIRSTLPHRRSSFSTGFHARSASFHRLDNDYLPTSTQYSIIVDGTATTSVKEFVYSGQSNSTDQSPNETGNKYTAGAHRVDTFSGISGLDLKRDEDCGVRRARRQSGAESIEEVDRPLDGDQLNAKTTIPSDKKPTVRTPGTKLASMPLGAAALRYRSRGNFAALVDPLKTGGRAPALAESANKWRQLATAGDNSISTSPLIEETILVPAATSSSRIFTDSDSIDVKVIHIAINDSVNVTHSASFTTQTLNDISLLGNNEMPNSTMVPSDEWNCSKAMKNLGVQAVLQLRISDSAVAMCVYTLSFLFAMVAVCAVTGLILSFLCIHNRRSPHVADRRSSSQVVLGLVVLAAAARALHYFAVKYQLLATVATPGGLRAIYECWFPFIIAAFFVHQRQLKNDLVSSSKNHRLACWRDLRVFSLVLCFYLKLVFLSCLLIDFCVIPVEAVFVFRFVFVLFAVSLSLANIPIITLTTSGRHIATQVVLCALFVICAGFSAVNVATLLSDDFFLLFQQNANVPIAIEAADGVAELFISVLLCINSALKFSGFQCNKSQKSVSVGRKVVLMTKVNKRKIADHGRSKLSTNSPAVSQSWLSRLLDSTLKKSKVVDVGKAPTQISPSVVHTLGWTAAEDPANVDCVLPLPPFSRILRSRSMLYNDHGFIRFRQDGDTDGESDARTLDDDGGGPRSVPASEYASAESLSFYRGPSSTATPRWSRPGSPSLAGFRAPSIHLQDSIDRALDRCDIWRVGREHGQLSVDELRRIIELYADVGDRRRGNWHHQRGSIPLINYAEV